MTVREMHIYLDQATQKLSSNQGRRIFPEQKDFALNVAVSRFMNQFRPQPGEIVLNDQFELDKVRTLIESRELDVYIDEGKNGEGFSILPADYYHLLEDSSNVKDIGCDEIVEEEAITKYIKVLEFPQSTDSSNHYSNVILKEQNVEKFNINSYVTSGFKSKEERFVVVDLIIKELTKKGFEIYWETYGEKTVLGSFIIVSDNNKGVTLHLRTETKTATIEQKTYKAFKDKTGEYRGNRLTRNSKVRTLTTSSFLKSSPRSHISYLENNKLRVIFSPKSIVSKLLISFIRKPGKISLLLNQASDLPIETHTEICDLAVEVLEKWTQNPNYSVEVKDNLLRNN